jgi:PAS domain S-box-containing protein
MKDVYMKQKTDARTILIVDDTPSNLGMVVNLLEGHGYRVAIAQDGEEGLQRARILQPDLILLDVMMPGMDGFETCLRLKSLVETRDIPVIFMTALASSEHKVKGFAAGGVDYIPKPLQIEEVIARVDTHIKLHAVQQQLEIQNVQLLAHQQALEQRVEERTAELSAANLQLQGEIEVRKQTGQALEESRAQLRSLALRNQASSEEERKYLARELHEELAQILAGIQLNISAIKLRCASDLPALPALTEALQKNFSLIDSAINVVRNVSSILRPVELDMGIVSALELISRRFRRHIGIQCEVHIAESGVEIGEFHAIGLYRIVQESLDNVAQHAKAERVDISLGRELDHYVLKIRDNGAGFDVNEKKSDSLGLVSIRERAFALGGSLSIESRPGDGTEIKVMVPAGATDGLPNRTIWNDISEPGMMNKYIIPGELSLRSVLDSSPDTIIRYDLEGRINFINARLLKVLQKPEAELIGKLPHEVWPDGRFAGIERTVFSVLQTQVDQVVEQINTPLNGKAHFQQIRVGPEWDSEGKLVGVIAYGRDITDLVQREKHLDMLEKTVNRSQEAVYLIDTNMRFVYVNEAACRALKYSRDELIGLTPSDVDPDFTNETVTLIQEQMNSRGSFYFESFHQRSDGTQFPVEIRGSKFESHGDVLHMTLVRDITERKQSEQSFRELHLQLRQLMVHLEKTREEERQLLAREVHDELGQILTALKLNISVIDRKFATGLQPLHDYVQETMKLMETAIASARNISAALRAAELSKGIVSALRWQAARFTTFTGIKCELHTENDEVNLDEDTAAAIYRITQESLTNIAKHANADKVDIVFEVRDNLYVLKIRDDGSGFDINIRKANSFGLLGIRERANILGGMLVIESSIGQGTELIVSVPKKLSSEEV